MKDKIEALDLAKYLIKHDVGLSARTIIATFFNLDFEPFCIPWDDDDWGRCMEVIRLFGWSDISFMRSVSNVWTGLADNFETLRDFHNAGEHKKIYDLIDKIIKEANHEK